MLFYAQKYCGRPVKFSCRRPVPGFSFRSVINIDNKGSARLIYFGLAGKREGKTTGIFMSSAYKADFGYCGKSSKNSLN